MDNLKKLRESRFNGLTDQIDFYFHLSLARRLSREQTEHLQELKDAVSCFGEQAQKWAELADEILKVRVAFV